MSCTYIVAGNFIQAEDYAYRNNLRDWFYVRDASWLRGRTIYKDQVVHVGSFAERSDIQEIERNLMICTRG